MTDWWLAVQLLALSGFSVLAYSLRALDGRGALASFVLGLAIILGGGLSWLVLMAVFTGVAYVATRLQLERKRALGVTERRGGERGWTNVLGNGAAPGLAALAAFVDPEAGRVAFVAAVAAILADTMGSEIGVLSDRARLAVPPFHPAKPGSNGAVSVLGQASSIVGAALIGAAAVPLLGVSGWQAAGAALAGLLGSQLDSVLGATLERDLLHNDRPLGKQDVNFLASFFPALVVFMATTL